MAHVNRGDTGTPHEVHVGVCTPYPETAMIDDVVIECTLVDGPPEWGFPVTIKLSRDEALDLCSDLALRLKQPQPRKSTSNLHLLGKLVSKKASD